MSDEPYKTAVPQRISRLPPYLFGRINKMKYEKRVAGVDIIDLGMGNPTDPTPDSVVEKLAEAAKDRAIIATAFPTAWPDYAAKWPRNIATNMAFSSIPKRKSS